MLFYLISRATSSAGAYLYPAYASFKALSRRPASETELERWLMYWSVMGVIVATEYVAEWLVSWIPFYWTLKTIFLLYLALPQTQGSTFLYQAHLAPLLKEHEPVIDDYLNAFKVQFFEFLQDKARRLWQQVASSVGVAQSNAATAPESRDITGAGEASRPPSINNPLGGTAQTVWNLWHTYGPHIMATGATMLQNAAPQNRPVPPQAPLSARSVPSPPHTPLSDDFRSSESEQEHPGPSFPVPVPASPFLELPSSLPLPPSSSHSPQTESDSDADPSGRYEEIETDEGEGYSIPQRPVQQERRSSWWGGWAAGKEGYDRVKEE